MERVKEEIGSTDVGSRGEKKETKRTEKRLRPWCGVQFLVLVTSDLMTS